MNRYMSIVCSVVFVGLLALPCQVSAASITEKSAAIGEGCVASGPNATAIGLGSIASGDISTSIGRECKARGVGSIAMGGFAEVLGYWSIAMGAGVRISSNGATLIGYGFDENRFIENDREKSFMVAYMGSETDTSPDFFVMDGAVGIGTKFPSEALDIDKGDLLVQGKGSFDAAGEEAYVFLGDANNYIKGKHGTGVVIGTWAAGDVITIQHTNGNVGIGTGTSSVGYKLAVNGSAAKPGGGSWSVYSDARLKDVTGGYSRGLDAVLGLNPVMFRYKEDNPRGLPTDEEYIGFVAQEVKEVFPEAVSEDDDGYLDFNMHPVNVALVNAVRELKAENDALRKEIQQIKAALGM